MPLRLQAARTSPLNAKSKRNLKKAYPSHPKERGEWVELLFMANAARLGLKVAKPHGDSSRYDVLVEGEGKLHRVQVKSTTFKRNGCHQCLCFWRTKPPQSKNHPAGNASSPLSKRTAQQYSEQQTDFVAAYVVPEDTWFIIPASEIRTKSMHLPPRDQPERNRYGQFLEAWHLLGVKTQGLTIHASTESDLVLALIKFKLAETIKKEELKSQNEE